MNRAMGGHQSASAATVEWLTPPFIIEKLGPFDLDPCFPRVRPWDTAREHFSMVDDGLSRLWFGRVWLNPPYGLAAAAWLKRLALHQCGTALVFARTETQMFFDHVWNRASAVLFLEGRLNFHHSDGSRAKANAGAPSVLIAYGNDDAQRLGECGINGKFLPIPNDAQCVVIIPMTWAELIRQTVTFCGGTTTVQDAYRSLKGHPKTSTNQHWKAKIRQVLQGRGFKRVGPGVYRLAEGAA